MADGDGKSGGGRLDDGTLFAGVIAGGLGSFGGIVLVAAPLASLLSGRGWSSSSKGLEDVD